MYRERHHLFPRESQIRQPKNMNPHQRKIKAVAAHSKVQGLALVLIMGTLPDSLVERLTARELATVVDLCEATYLDDYTAAGGDPSDTVPHCQETRDALNRAA